MKKKAFIVAVLALALVLSVVALAGAKYAGYAYNNPYVDKDGKTVENPTPGYLSWSGAQSIVNNYAAGSTGSNMMDSPHGGYVTTTTKCATCHSAHRAFSDKASTAGVTPTDTSLTAGAAGCVNCHTAFGAGAADKQIEWANILADPEADAGPHSSFDCTENCHSGGVHGTTESQFHGMNAYMLGSQKDTAIQTALEAGNTNANLAYNKYYKSEMGMTGANWFQAGSSEVPSNGLPPKNVSAPQLAAAQSTATGYTCAQAGCHTSSQFAVNQWGFSQMHTSQPGDKQSEQIPFTGHGTGTMSEDMVSGGCGPCHPGNLAGGYRYGSPDSTADDYDAAHQKATQYGCDQCHDVVGQATNTTAFPHGNRGIVALQWTNKGDDTNQSVALTGKNLWMYQASIVTRDAVPSRSPYEPGGTAGGRATDQSQRVVQGAAASTEAGPGNINDGVCLKCHVAVDSKSLAAIGGTGQPYVATDGWHDHHYTEGMTNKSNEIYLWK